MANLWLESYSEILSDWTPAMEIQHITDSTLLVLGLLFLSVPPCGRKLSGASEINSSLQALGLN